MSEDFDRTYWEQRYRGHSAAGHRRSPNPHLVAEAADLAPGRALDAGCGEGADARWLAARGWRVTAVDISATALRRARDHAEALGPDVTDRIDWVEADLTERAPAEAGFDLVSAQYVHAAVPRAELFGVLAAAVAPGGTLLVVGHAPSDGHGGDGHGGDGHGGDGHGGDGHGGDGHGGDGHAPAAGSHITAEEVAAALDADRWEIVVAETRRHRVAGPHGREITMCDAVLRARRRQVPQ